MRPRRGRISDGAAITPVGMLLVYRIYYFTHLPIYQSTHQPVYRHPIGVPFGGVSCSVGRSVGSSGKPSSRYGYSNSPPSGTPQPTYAAAHIRHSPHTPQPTYAAAHIRRSPQMPQPTRKNSNDRFWFILKTSPFLWWGRSFMYFCNDVLRERLTGNWNAYLSPEAH